MRKIGTIPSASQASRFHAYLASQGVQNRIDAQNGHHEVWVFDEDRVAAGKDALTEFLKAPSAARFDAPEPPKPEVQEERPVVVFRRRQARVPFTVALISASIAASLMTDFTRSQPALVELLKLNFISLSQPWRLFTPMFLHGDLFHLLFNMYWLWMFGGIIERARGSGRFAGVVLLTALGAHLTQYFYMGGNFVGMSGVVYGLFGYIWARSTMFPSDGMEMPPGVVAPLMIWLVVCATGVIGPVADGAHFGGLAAGLALGVAPRLWRLPG